MTREEAIKILKFERGYFCDLKGCQELQAFTMAIKALEQQPSWIPVSERLPKKPDGYPHCAIYRIYFLVSLESGCVKTLAYEFERDEWQITGSPVKAWMPLPEPYKQEAEDEN